MNGEIGPWVIVYFFVTKGGQKVWEPDYQHFETSPGNVRGYDDFNEALARAAQIRLMFDWVLDIKILRRADL